MTTDHVFTFRPAMRAEDFRPALRDPLQVVRPFSIPERISCERVSIVVPVRNNQAGVDRFLTSLIQDVEPQEHPREVIIVDNNSDEMTTLRVEVPFPVQVLACAKPGPGAARNVGAAHASGEWVLFTDSDCIATPSLVSGYVKDSVGAIAYAGRVATKVVDQCSLYYLEQNTFLPAPLATAAGVVPATVVTANCLVLKDALLAVGGFDERFIYAGGEDTELGYRLRMIGHLQYSLSSTVAHEVNDGLPGFVERFIRYGRGSRLLDIHYDNPGMFISRRPVPPNNPTPANGFLAEVQYHATWWGYLAESTPELLAFPRDREA